MPEPVFEVVQEPDGGYCAECLTESIFTEADTWDELRKNVLKATSAFFFDRVILEHQNHDMFNGIGHGVPCNAPGPPLKAVLGKDRARSYLDLLMIHSSIRRAVLNGLVAALLGFTGCTTPLAVREFTAVAKDAATEFPPLVRDLTQSCIRRQMASRPPDEIADASDEARSACKNLADLEPRLLGTLNVLTNYLNALNQLASDQMVSYDKDIDRFASSVQSAGSFGEPQVKAVGGLAKFLANAAASGYQHRKLGEALQAADQNIAVVTDGLGKVIGEDYLRVLQNEENALRSRYRDAIQGDPSKSPAAALMLQEYWRRDLAGLDQKRAAARDVQEILVKIRDGHRKLAEQAKHWTARDVVQTLGPYAGSIQALMVDYRKAF